ncbi:DUF6215 domain-containing protein [Streptomyces chartreusis]|uniref:DUF6215 domain-containing protein n=1 Tax=Streptomyces chartreusis TaxID=1969 RepID=UPI0037112A62
MQSLIAVTGLRERGREKWAYGRRTESSGGPPPATCSDGTPGKPTGRVTGAQLCEALLRPDLSELLGTPAEEAKTASGSDGSFGLPGATYDGRLRVAGSESLLREAEKRTVLGRPAVLYSDRTIRMAFRLDGGGDADSGPGVPLRSLMVAKDAEGGGGSFDVTLWRSDGMVPGDAVLLRLAEKVLPTVPGWTAGS